MLLPLPRLVGSSLHPVTCSVSAPPPPRVPPVARLQQARARKDAATWGCNADLCGHKDVANMHRLPVYGLPVPLAVRRSLSPLPTSISALRALFAAWTGVFTAGACLSVRRRSASLTGDACVVSLCMAFTIPNVTVTIHDRLNALHLSIRRSLQINGFG